MIDDRRLVLPALAAWGGAAAGVAGASAWRGVTGAGLLVSALALLWAVRRRRAGAGGRVAGTLCAVAACLAAGAASGAVHVAARDAGPVAGWARDGGVVTARATLAGDPRQLAPVPGRPAAERSSVTAVLTSVRRGDAVALARTPVLLTGSGWPALLDGAQVELSGRLAPAPPGRPYAALLRVRAIAVRQPAGVAARLTEPLRRGLREAAAGLPGGSDGLLPALVLGDESALDPVVVSRMKEAGLTHLTAVSGANLAIATASVVAVAVLLGLRGRAVQVVGMVAVLGFVLVARPQPSVLRAAVMAVVLLLAVGVGARGRALAALALAVLVLVLADPWLATNPGFVLSVMATGGLVLLGPRWTRAAAGWLPLPAAASLAVALAAQVAVTPALVWLDGRLPLAALPANLLAEPAVGVATVLGLAVAVLSLLHTGAAAALAQVAALPTRWIVAVAGWAADLPGASAPAPNRLVLLGGLGLAVAGVPVVLRSRAATVLLAATVALLLVRPAPLVAWPPHGWVVVACDVGQGDALVLRSGPHRAVVVDAGPDPEPVRRCLDALDVRDVDALVLTHFHVDHVAGLPGVLAGRDVAQILVGPLSEPAEQARWVRRQAAAAGVPVRVTLPGELRVAGAASWRVLWPRRVIRDDGSVPNNASVVLLADVGGLRLLLAGDVEPAAQAALRRAEPALRADVLKVPHHGSAHQDAALLTGLGARVALVSVGTGNDYGHPAAETLRLLAQAGMQVARTDTGGSVAVVAEGGRPVLVPQRR